MGYTTLPKHATKTMKLEFGIRKIIEIDMPVDWEWYENAIIDLIDKLEIRLLEGADFDLLNARKITDDQISDWVLFNTELQTVEH